MLDLFNNKYDRKTLKDNIYAVNFMDLLKTQTIDASFAIKYLMNKNYDLNDKYRITPDIIMKFQPHIKLIELINEKIKYDSAYDSVDDFETVSNK